MPDDPTTTPPAMRALLMERRRALYAQLKGVETTRQGILMEISAIERATTKETDHGSTDRQPGTHAQRRRQE